MIKPLYNPELLSTVCLLGLDLCGLMLMLAVDNITDGYFIQPCNQRDLARHDQQKMKSIKLADDLDAVFRTIRCKSVEISF